MRFPPPSAAEISQAEAELGRKLPPALLALYAAKGNGGFGPDYGLLGIDSGHTTDLGDSAMGLYRMWRQPDPEDPGWSWPAALLPILHVGCAVHCCIDLTDPNFRVLQFDPNGYGPGDDLQDAITVVSPSLEPWLSRL